MLADMQADAARHGRTIVVTMEDDPAIIARPQALHRCIGNLVSNALTYAPHVALTVCQEGRFALIHVDDDGPGIPAHQREAVFRPFYRLDEARNQNESGTGLGLAIARDIARAHGGDIILSTSAEGGLRASLRLPL
jgi:two-component system osmolarity sensor histidine kinase EnvZ